jgi:hypothetical protein
LGNLLQSPCWCSSLEPRIPDGFDLRVLQNSIESERLDVNAPQDGVGGVIRRSIDRGNHLFGSLLVGRRRPVFVTAVFVAGFVCCGAYSVKLGAFNTWDLRNYQYYSPYALLNHRFDFDYAPAQIQTFLNPVPFVPFYLAATHLKPMVAGFVMGGIHGLVAGLLFLTAMVLFSPMAPLPRVLLSLLCAAVGMYGPTFIAFLGGSGNDIMVSPFVLAAVYALVRGIGLHGAPDARGSRVALLSGGALIGMAAGLKLVCVVFLIGYGAAVLVTGRGCRSRLAATGIFGIAGVVGVLISRGYWMAYLWSRFGSPLFPFYNKIFQSPYYYHRNFADTRYIPKTFEDAVTLPFHFVSDTEFTSISYGFRDMRYTLVYGLILLCLIVLAVGLVRALLRRPLSTTRRPDRAEVFLLVFFVVSYVVWQMKFAIMRYAVPLELLAPIVIVVLIRLLLAKDYLRFVATMAAFAAIVAVMQPRVVPRRYWTSSYIDVKAPRFRNPSNVLVILANNRPWSYVIPAFQPQVRFLGLANSFSKPVQGHQHKAADEMYKIIESHRGPVYLLSSDGRITTALRRIEQFHIVQASRVCLPVETIHEPARLCLWPVELK